MRRDHHYFTYLLASKPNGTLYAGMTNDLPYRVAQHKAGIGSRFTSRYGVDRLVWFEEHQYVHRAIAREKTLKGWSRDRKIALIEEANPFWSDLSSVMELPDLQGEASGQLDSR